MRRKKKQKQTTHTRVSAAFCKSFHSSFSSPASGFLSVFVDSHSLLASVSSIRKTISSALNSIDTREWHSHRKKHSNVNPLSQGAKGKWFPYSLVLVMHTIPCFTSNRASLYVTDVTLSSILHSLYVEGEKGLDADLVLLKGHLICFLPFLRWISTLCEWLSLESEAERTRFRRRSPWILSPAIDRMIFSLSFIHLLLFSPDSLSPRIPPLLMQLLFSFGMFNVRA